MMQKKFLLSLSLLLLVSAVSWAQITFGSWGRVVVTPFAFSGEHSAVSAATSTWGDAPYISFTANGLAPSENIGFKIEFDFGYNLATNGYNIVGDNAFVWIKPLGWLVPEQFNMLRLVAGRFNEDELRGKIGATDFASWIVPNGSKDEDNLFTRFKASAGAYVRLEPFMWLDSEWNGLTLHAVFGSNALGANGNKQRAILNLYNNEANKTEGSNVNQFYNDGWDEYDGVRNTSALDVYRAGQYAIGYQIPNIGLARFQFIGGNRNVWRLKSIADNIGRLVDDDKQLVVGVDRGDRTKNADKMEFAFLYDGLKGFKLDLGVKLPMEYETDNSFEVIQSIFYATSSGWLLQPGVTPDKKKERYTVQMPKILALGLEWNPSFLSDLKIMARVDFSFGGKIEGGSKTGNSGITKVESGYTLGAWFVPSYKISNALTFGLDFGIDIHDEDKITRDGYEYNPDITAVTKYTDLGFAPWIEINVGGGRLRTGVVMMFPGSPRYKADSNNRVTPLFLGDPVISIPISITYNF